MLLITWAVTPSTISSQDDITTLNAHILKLETTIESLSDELRVLKEKPLMHGEFC